MMNPRDDKKSMTKIVAKAMIASLDHDGVVLDSGTVYVPVVVSIIASYLGHYRKTESIPLKNDVSNVFGMIAVRRLCFEL
jgi:NAD/NADP transhydrogenase beta subunit